MNERGREALVKAALDGVPQAFGSYGDGTKQCAMAVLARAVGIEAHGYQHDYIELRVVERVFELIQTNQACPECREVKDNEVLLIQHLNDGHEFDFLTIARKLA